MQLVIEDLVGSTGLELKVDPGVPYVYAGFAGRPNSAPVWYAGSMCQSLSVTTWQQRLAQVLSLGSVTALYLHVPCVTSGRCNVEFWCVCMLQGNINQPRHCECLICGKLHLGPS